jgi:uncharacterized membrane protein (DUF373 family)
LAVDACRKQFVTKSLAAEAQRVVSGSPLRESKRVIQPSARQLQKETAIAAKPVLRESLSALFTGIEDAIYIALGMLLGAVAGVLLVTEIISFVQYVIAGALAENIVSLLDRILLIIIFVEVLYTVQVSFRQHVLQPGPFLVVGMIAVVRRILVLTAELPKMIKENNELFRHSMLELALLTVLIVALVLSLRFMSPRDPSRAAEEGLPKEKG